MKELLRLDHLATKDSGCAPLRDLCLTVFAGEIVFLTGVHGSGKHALARVLNGELPAEGRIYVEEHEVPDTGEESLAARGVICVEGIKSLVGSLTISENLFAIRPRKKMGVLYNEKSANIETEHILKEYGLDCRAQDRVKGLKPSDQYVLCIAKAISRGAKLLVLDCTEQSFYREYGTLQAALKRLKARGYAFLLLDNTPNPLLEEADRAVIVSEGRDMKMLRAPHLSYSTIKEYWTQNTGESNNEQNVAAGNINNSGGYRLTVNRLEPADIPRNGILGIYELRQSWEAMFERFVFSFIHLNEITLISAPENKTMDWANLAIIPENAEDKLLYNLSLGDNLLLPTYPHVGNVSLHDGMRRYVEEMFCSEIGKEVPAVEMNELSRCERKELCIQRWRLARASAIIMQNPDFGLDLSDRRRIIKVLKETAAAGIPTLITSQNAFVLRSCCASVIVTNGGRAQKVLKGAEVSDLIAWT